MLVYLGRGFRRGSQKRLTHSHNGLVQRHQYLGHADHEVETGCSQKEHPDVKRLERNALPMVLFGSRETNSSSPLLLAKLDRQEHDGDDQEQAKEGNARVAEGNLLKVGLDFEERFGQPVIIRQRGGSDVGVPARGERKEGSEQPL
jgi:hypothetical protein